MLLEVIYSHEKGQISALLEVRAEQLRVPQKAFEKWLFEVFKAYYSFYKTGIEEKPPVMPPLYKISCCVYEAKGVRLPDWYNKANGKFYYDAISQMI